MLPLLQRAAFATACCLCYSVLPMQQRDSLCAAESRAEAAQGAAEARFQARSDISSLLLNGMAAFKANGCRLGTRHSRAHIRPAAEPRAAWLPPQMAPNCEQ